MFYYKHNSLNWILLCKWEGDWYVIGEFILVRVGLVVLVVPSAGAASGYSTTLAELILVPFFLAEEEDKVDDALSIPLFLAVVALPLGVVDNLPLPPADAITTIMN